MSRYIPRHQQDVIDAAEKWVEAAERLRSADIDAACCRTDRDYDKMHVCQEKKEEAETNFLKVLEAAMRAEARFPRDVPKLKPDAVLAAAIDACKED